MKFLHHNRVLLLLVQLRQRLHGALSLHLGWLNPPDRIGKDITIGNPLMARKRSMNGILLYGLKCWVERV